MRVRDCELSKNSRERRSGGEGVASRNARREVRYGEGVIYPTTRTRELGLKLKLLVIILNIIDISAIICEQGGGLSAPEPEFDRI